MNYNPDNPGPSVSVVSHQPPRAVRAEPAVVPLADTPDEEEVRAVCWALAKCHLPDRITEEEEFALRTSAYAFYRPSAVAAIKAMRRYRLDRLAKQQMARSPLFVVKTSDAGPQT